MSSAFYCYDANGNVTDLVGTNGEFLAQYQFDPYGNTISKTGALADVNPFRFSTKYTDSETGLLYYGYRFYQPEIGRWCSRDPLGEKSFVILRQAMGRNAATQRLPKQKFPSSLRTTKGLNQAEESRNWVIKVAQRAMAAANRFQINDPALMLPFLFVKNNPISRIDVLGLDSPGCDIPFVERRFLPACYLECCARHDACYDNFDCSASSWITRLCRIRQDPCDVCNADAAGCITGCAAGEEDADDPNEWNYYCGECHAFFDDPNEHAGHGD